MVVVVGFEVAEARAIGGKRVGRHEVVQDGVGDGSKYHRNGLSVTGSSMLLPVTFNCLFRFR